MLPFECSSCGSRWATRALLEEHVARGCDHESEFRCASCGLELGSRRELWEHNARPHAETTVGEWRPIGELLEDDDDERGPPLVVVPDPDSLQEEAEAMAEKCGHEGCGRPAGHGGRHYRPRNGSSPARGKRARSNGHGTVRITLTVPIEALLGVATIERVET